MVPGEGNGNPLQYSCPRNPMDRGGWWIIVHGVSKSQTQLGTHAPWRYIWTWGRLSPAVQFSSVQLLSCVWLFVTPWTAPRQASLSITNSRAFSNSCPLSQWCHPTISSSVVPFSSCPQSFPASGSFPVSQFFASGDHSIGISASASVLQVNIQDWFPWGWTGLISLESKGLSRVFSNTTVQKHQFFSAQLSL